ncbi:MAG: methylated-DNA--[protein]-cysteine S-methyltransferase [bacterium JZ-2024 1]
MALYYLAVAHTPAGCLYFVHDRRRILKSTFRESLLRTLVSRPIKMMPLKEVAAALEDYRSGRQVDFSPFIVFPEGTPHQVRVWRALLEIPAGMTLTYGALAERLFGNGSRGARAIGQAVSANPLPFFIPCHRVVAVSGLGGYGEGLTVKRKLLDFERMTFRDPGKNIAIKGG